MTDDAGPDIEMVQKALDLDRAASDLNKAEDSFIAAKEKRKVCPECGSVKTTPAVERQVDKTRDIVRQKRAAYRKARNA